MPLIHSLKKDLINRQNDTIRESISEFNAMYASFEKEAKPYTVSLYHYSMFYVLCFVFNALYTMHVMKDSFSQMYLHVTDVLNSCSWNRFEIFLYFFFFVAVVLFCFVSLFFSLSHVVIIILIGLVMGCLLSLSLSLLNVERISILFDSTLPIQQCSTLDSRSLSTLDI